MIERILLDPELLIAAVAVFISFLSILIGALSLRMQRSHNRKSVKPIGNILFSDYENLIAVNIKNTGIGPLIIKKLEVTNSSKSPRNNIIDWMPQHPKDLTWSNFLSIGTNFVIPPNQSLNIIELKTGQNISKTFAEFRDEIRKVLSDLTIELVYVDLYNKKQPVNRKELRWFGRNVK